MTLAVSDPMGVLELRSVAQVAQVPGTIYVTFTDGSEQTINDSQIIAVYAEED